jgi:hypothetical protein
MKLINRKIKKKIKKITMEINVEEAKNLKKDIKS